MCLCWSVINTGEVGIVERCGKFARPVPAGCHFIACPCEYLAGRVSLRVGTLNMHCETKTRDNVFVTVKISVQFQAVTERVFDAYYSLADTHRQMESYIYDVVRATIPLMTLDQAFESKEEVAMAVRKELSEVFFGYGYMIMQALITDLDPDDRVRNAMNEINASTRMKLAAAEKAEADKVLQVKAAEAECEAKYLSGVGVARQRKALMDGMRDSIVDFSAGMEGIRAKDVMDLLLLTQYFDMLRDVGSAPMTQTVFLPTNGGAEISDSVRDGLMQAQAIGHPRMLPAAGRH